MSENRGNLLKSSMGVAFATLLSRLLGLIRVMLEASVLGGGVFAGAWQLAFMWPNLFRRLLGEGALGTALIPLITATEEHHGSEKMRGELTVIFAVLGVVLGGVAFLCAGVAIFLQQFSFQEHVMLALRLIPLLMPYTVFICLVGAVGAVLNTRKCFFLPALGALLLNIFLIAGLALLPHDNMMLLLEELSYLVLFSGAVQLLGMLILLQRTGAFPLLSRRVRESAGVLRELWCLTLPGLIGASALQVSFIIDRLLAASLGAHAVPALTYTDRLIDLPIGIFAISVGSVLMPAMARAAAKKDFNMMCRDLHFGLKQIYFICVPMAVFVLVFREPLLRVILMRGRFSEVDLQATAQAAFFYGMGIPAFCSLKVILPAFYARKEMRKPLFVSLFCISLNVVLNLILMHPLQQGGIALATVIASMANNAILLWLLRREGLRVDMRGLLKSFLRAAVAAGGAGCVYFFYGYFAFAGKYGQFGIGFILFGVLYFLLSLVLRNEELSSFIEVFIKRNRKNV